MGQNQEKDITPLPWRELFLIWVIHASQAFQTTMLFPMLVFMVKIYGVPDHATGKYAGLLASLFPLAQFCTSLLWGKISDKTGRKKWLAFGNAVSALSSTLLGLCSSFPAACAVRFVGGLLNGTVTITKSTLGELCDGSNQARGFGILNLAWGIGSIAGPVFAGLLAQPCHQYKLSSCFGFLSDHPFLLPCLCATFFSTISVFAAFSLEETKPTKLTYETLQADSKESRISPLFETKGEFCLHPIVQCDTSGDSVMSLIQPRDTFEVEVAVVRKTKLLIAAKGQGEENGFAIIALNVEDESEEEGRIRRIRHMQRPLWKDRDVLLSSLCYSMTGLIFIITDELFPLFGAASVAVGGLGLNSSALGLILGEGGVVLFLYTLLLYPVIAQRFGPLQSFRFGILATVPIWMMFPGSSALSSLPNFQTALLLLAMAARSMAACTVFTGVLILVTNSATQENKGAVTGLSHSFCSFFRAVGPALGGVLWSLSSQQQSFPLHQFVAWFVVILLTFFTFALSFLLPPTLARPKVITFQDH